MTAVCREIPKTFITLFSVAFMMLMVVVACAQKIPPPGAPAEQQAPADAVPADATDAPQDDRALLFSDSFDDLHDHWDAGTVSAAITDGALVFSAQQSRSLILRQALPMDEIVIEFRAKAEANGIQVYLMKTQTEHYSWLLGMGGNQHSMLVDDASGQALETVVGSAYTAGEWHTWRLVRRGTTLEAYRDGQLIISSGVATGYSGEGLLVFSTDNASIALDDLRIYHTAVIDDTQVADNETAEPGQADTEQTDDVQDANPYEAVPLAADSAVKRAVICLGFDDRSGLRGVQEVFPAGTEKVALYMEMEDAHPNSEIQMMWQKDGTILARQLLLVSGSKKNLAYLYASGRAVLWDGHYAVDIKENGRFVGRVTFRVGE